MRTEGEKPNVAGRDMPTGAPGLELNSMRGKGGQAREWLSLAARILDLLNRSQARGDVVQNTIDFVKEVTGIEQVDLHAITSARESGEPTITRLCRGLEPEGSAGLEGIAPGDRPCISCMFGAVLSGSTDSSLPFFTKNGSFWTDTRVGLQSAVSQVEPGLKLSSEGWESLAIIPLRRDDEVVGLLELKDGRKGYISEDMVDFLERMGASIAVALARTETHEANRSREEKYQTLFEVTTNPIVVLDNQGTLIDFNRAASEFLGLKGEEAAQRNLAEFAPRGGIEALLGEISAFRKATAVEVESRTGDQTRTLELTLTRVLWHDEQVVLGIGSDVTLSKVANKALRESERRLKEAQTIGEVGDWEMDAKTGEVKWSEELFRLFERERSEGPLSVEESLSYHSQEDRLTFRDQLRRAVETGEEFNCDYRLRLSSGRSVWLRCIVRPVRDTSGAVVKLRGTFQDMTTRREVEEGLRRAEEKYRDLVENLNEAVYNLDIAGVVTYVSPVVESVLGYTSREVVGRPFSSFIHEKDLPQYLRDLEKTLSGETARGDYRGLTKSGDTIWVRASNRPILGRERVVGVGGILMDITSARESEARVRESEENYRSIVELAPDGIITLDSRGVVTSCNSAFLQLYGHERQDIVGRNFAELPAVRPEEVPRYAEIFSSALNGEIPPQIELAWENRAGDIKHAEVRFRVIRKNDEVTGVQCITRDTTDRKAAEEELRKSEALYRNLVETMNDGLAIQDERGLVAYANHRFCEMLGFTWEEVIGKPLASLMDKENFEIVNEQTEQRKDGKKSSYELSWTSKDGRVVNTLTSGSPITDPEGRLIGSFGVITDITEIKRAQKALRESEEKLRAVFESAADGVVLLDSIGRIQDLNETLLGIFRYEKKCEVVGRNALEFVVESQRLQAMEVLKRVFNTGTIARSDYTCTRKDGTSFPAQVSAAPLRLGSGLPSGFVVVVADVTEQEKAEEEIRKFKTISDRAGYGVVIADLAGQISYVNDALAEMLGCPAQELKGQSVAGLKYDWREEDERWLLALLEKERKFVGKEVWLKRNDGTGFPALMNATLIRNERGEPLLMAATCVDITERKKAEEEKEKAEGQLRHSQKMEALGTLAGGIAHDFNNLLTAIGGYADLALSKTPKDDVIASHLSNIRDASSRAARLTSQLLTFSRRQVVSFRCLELNKVVLNMIKMLNRLIGEKYTIVTDLDPCLLSVTGDLGHVEQIIMNVVVNAKDAMPDGGEIRIATRNTDVLEAAPDRPQGKYVCLSIRDFGTGMDEETAARIFDPFFSTKGAGKGTGIGLAVVYGIVKRHGGWIEVETAPGKGSEFRIFLPATAETPERDVPDAGSLEAVSGRGEKVLVVEDEDRVRDFAGNVLSENGYKVSLARNAAEAGEVFAREKANLDLVFSDVVLPGKSGLELVKQFLHEKPGLSVLLASGYGRDDADYETIEHKGYPFIQKPYQMLDLLKALRGVLDRRGKREAQ
jgi:two-component system cell cycle sensor histidine kinase/response regulator CckA